MLRGLRSSTRSSATAAFVDSCYHHCGGWADFAEIESWQDASGATVNITASVAFAQWRTSPKSNLWTQPTPYPCLGTTCCGAHGPDGVEAREL